MTPSDFIATSNGDVTLFRNLLEASLQSGVTDESLNDLDDALIELSYKDPHFVVRLGEVAAELYNQYGRNLMYAYAMNIVIATHIDTRDAESLLKWLLRAVDHVIAHNLHAPGKSVIENARSAMNSEVLNRDEYLVVLRETIKFHTHFNEIPAAVDAYCLAATHFSELGAFQSAYRILKDADEMARHFKQIAEIPKLLSTQAAVAADEGDIPYAEAHFGKAINLLRRLNEPVPPEYLINLATMQMNLEKLEVAASTFKQLIDDPQLDKNKRLFCSINLAVCKRKLMAPDAVQIVEHARTLCDENSDVEALIELELVAGKTYIRAQRYSDAQQCLVRAVYLLDQELLSIARLHYRRGFRERFVNRVSAILCELPSQGLTEDILPVLAFIKSSSFSDWMYVLDWCETMLQGNVLTQEQRQTLTERLNNVLDIGAPVLYGYREKYEDPFESPEGGAEASLKLPSYNLPWREFNLIIREICLSTGMSTPLEAASISQLETLLAKKIETQSCLLFILNTSIECHIISIIGDKYTRTSFPRDRFIEFYVELIKYQDRAILLKELLGPLATATTTLSTALTSLFEVIIRERPSELIVIPDQLSDMLPLIPSLVADDRIRALLREGRLQLRYCPVLYPGKPVALEGDAFLGVWDSRDPLPLAKEEVNSVIDVLRPLKKDILDIGSLNYKSVSMGEFLDRVGACDYLHLSSHGVPIINFTDPHFATLGGSNVTHTLSVNMIQKHFWRYRYSLAMLNACHTSIVTSHNYQRKFKTNEIISYPALLLLNRRTQVIASQWTTFDIVAYVFTHFFYKRIHKGSSTSNAYTAALIDLYDANKEGILEILTNITDRKIREEKVQMISGSQEEYPFRHPYCYGTYILHSLL